MIRDNKSNVSPSQDQSPSKTKENKHPPALKNHNVLNIDINSTATSNNGLVSFDSFGHYIADCNEDATSFLPSPSFDDLQSSIFSSSNDLHMARTEDSIITAQQKSTSQKQYGSIAQKMTSNIKTGASTRSQPDPNPIKSATNSLRRVPSNRQKSVSSTASNVMDPSNMQGTARARRQSLHPFSAGAAIVNAAKAPRKSLVPNLPDAESSKITSSNRRPFSASSTQVLEEKGTPSNKTKSGNLKGLTAARAAKTKSLQPPPKNGQTSQGVANFEPQKVSPLLKKSQSRPSDKETMQSSARNRMSIVPGMPSQSHPTGLGAKTVSPTDARRIKRLSALQNSSQTGSTSPTQQSDTAVNVISFRSSSVLPVKVPTPTPSHTPPDPKRKSYNARISPSHAPAPNYNTVHESNGSLSLRLLPSVSSRILTNKSRSLHGSTGNEGEEEDEGYVPPVPEIPKAFESPKECQIDSTTFPSKKSSLLEPSSPGNMSFYNYSDSSLLQNTSSTVLDSNFHRIEFSDFKLNNDIGHKKKTLQPLRLPPFNLRPLSTNTATRVEAQEESKQTGTSELNPVQSGFMNESKSTLFGNKNESHKSFRSPSHSRSSSAIHFLRSTPHLNLSFSSKPSVTNNEGKHSGFQPVTTSIHKNSVDYGCMPRPKMSDDPLNVETPAEQKKAPRITRLREINPNKRSSFGETAQAPPLGSEESSSSISTSTSSLRRKLSLGWKRTTSKSSIDLSHALHERELANPPPIKKPDIGSPPRVLPSSNLINCSDGTLPSPSLSIKSTTYIDFKRRKSSASSLSMFSSYHDRTISESWTLQNCPSIKTNLNPERDAPNNRTSSMMHRMLNPRDSSSSVRFVDQWTVDLDRDDLMAEDEMKKLASKRKDTETAARQLEALRKRAIPKERISPQEAIRNINLNIFERGEVVDYKDVYFCGTVDAMKHHGELTSDNLNFGYDDERGDYSIVKGDHLSYRYEIIDLLGKGSFGQVVRCVDHKTGGLAAVKIIRNKKRFHQQALVEVKILQRLRDWDPKSKYSMVRFIQSFYFRGHLCISAELLDMNLYELIKSNSFRGFSLKIVRRFTKQILNSLLLLQQHKVIHCDLKPENVLLVHPLHSEIKVIDFGSSCFENEKVYTYIQSRFYRSPEVILGMTYGMAIDMWSLGCIMAELYSGVPIFPGENEQEQLACIMEVFGPPEKHLIEKSTRRKLFFDSVGKPRLMVSSKGRRRRPSSKTLQQVLKCDDCNFLDFLTKCLRWDPERRIKPDEAICHEFITGRKPTPSSCSSRYSSHRSDSSVKRNSTLTLASGNRPLPEPPSNGHNDTVTKNYETSGHKRSPTKGSAISGSMSRRQSAINDNLSSQTSRRQGQGLTNTSGIIGSTLPRISKNSNGRANSMNVSSSSYHGNQSHIGLTSGNAAGVVGTRRIQ